jgi:hypothetical protein
MDSHPLMPLPKNTKNLGQKTHHSVLPRLQVQGQPESSQDNSSSTRNSSFELQNQ